MQRCLGCMKEYGEEYDVCPYCGYIKDTPPKNKAHLPGGTMISGRYMLGRVLGYGGFGVTYIAWDSRLNRAVAIKEFFPNSLSTRTIGETRVNCYDDKASQYFKEGVKKMLDEGNRLSKFTSNENIVNVYDCFEENNTAYIVMEYLDGEDLKQYLNEKGGKLPPEEAVEIILPVINALKDMHKEKIIHRDISPDNIFLCSDGKIKLLDFGSARLAVEDSDKSLSIMLKKGFAPKEQYAGRSKQGPWTDVYAVCATLYKMITGELPPESLERDVEPLKSFSEFGIEGYDGLESVIRKGLEPEYTDRIQDVTELKIGLTEALEKKPETISENQEKPVTPKRKKPKVNVKAIIAAAAAVVLVTSVAVAVKFLPRTKPEKSETTSASPSVATNLSLNESEATSVLSQTTASKETITKAIKVYEAQLAEFESIDSAYTGDINHDGIPEIFFSINSEAQYYMMTYTEKSGLCVMNISGHSSVKPELYISENNRAYFRDDGHNKGTSYYHYASFRKIEDLGFVKTCDVVGDEWEDFDWEDEQLFEKMNAKYKQIFEEKLTKVIGNDVFEPYSDIAVSESVEDYLNKELSINISEKRKEYNQKYKEFYGIAESFNSEEVLQFDFGDFDYDGTYEAFAFAGHSTEETGYYGSVLFINRDGVAKALETRDFWTTGEVVGGKYNKYFQIAVYYTSASPAMVWQVKGDTCVTALEMNELQSLSFGLTHSITYPYLSETLVAYSNDYDSYVKSVSKTNGTGHTMKPYYFYETPDGIAEYGGKEIPLSELEKIDGYDEVYSLISENGYSVNNIYFRENGIININLYEVSDQGSENTEYHCCYMNLNYADNHLEIIPDPDSYENFGEGIYLPSKSTGLVTYPLQDSLI